MHRTTQGDKSTGTVYSTEHGCMCPECGKSVSQCTSVLPKTFPSKDEIIRVGLETKGHKGNGVTIITGLPLGPDGLRNLAKQLKQKCGSGGTVKAGVIENQGDHRDPVVIDLRTKGHTVKTAGGK